MTQKIFLDNDSDTDCWGEEDVPQHIISDSPPPSPPIVMKVEAKPRFSTTKRIADSRADRVPSQPMATANSSTEQNGRANLICQAFTTAKPVKASGTSKDVKRTKFEEPIVISDSEISDTGAVVNTDVSMGPSRSAKPLAAPPAPRFTTSARKASGTQSVYRPPTRATSSHAQARPSARPLKKSNSFSIADPPLRTPVRPQESLVGVPAPPQCDDPPTVGKFQNGRLGIDLDVEVIAHNEEIQRLMDARKLPWGVQYEIARGISHGIWTWEQVKEKIDKLPTMNAYAANVFAVMSGGPVNKVDHELWRELDREQAAILENKGRGLGLMGEWHGEQEWYGGKIQQLARVARDRDGYGFVIQLMPMEKRRSHRFARYLGSRRVLQLKVPDQLVNEENERVRKWLGKKFMICGRVYVPFHSKDSSVYMMETNEDYQRQPADWCGDGNRISFAQFINWHNPLDLNEKQPISKWSTRFAIGLSNSAPALEFQSKNIFMIDDIYSSSWKGEGKPSAEQTMTDGCGYMNRAALRLITRRFGYAGLPTAVQGRIMNAKGLWIAHPTDNDPEPRIWIRDSQNKIKLPHLDRGHRIFDLLAVSKPSNSVALSRQSIINLAFNGIPNEELVALQRKGLTAEVMPLMAWEGDNAMIHLYQEISKNGSVTSARAARLGAEKSRLLGLVGRDWGHDFIELHEAKKTTDIEEASTARTGRSEYSGAPLSLNEFVCEMIQAGFSPLYYEPLRFKLRYVIETTIINAIEKYRIPIEEGLSAFVVPDPLGVLKEGEIFYRSSVSMTDPDSLMQYDVLLGEVLVGRYPIRLPSDVQRVKAVDVPQLHDWTDVIIVPTVGEVSFASLLSGGDYDGDEPFILRQRSLVQAFQNQPLTKAPDNLMSHFEKHVQSVTEFNERAHTLKPTKAQFEFQQILLLGLFDAKVGIYSNFHDLAVWKKGYSDPGTILVAYIFGILLDSSKTGHRLLTASFKEHQKMFGGTMPDELGPEFVLGALKKAGRELHKELMEHYSKLESGLSPAKDPQLREPYEKAVERAELAAKAGFKGYEAELDILRAHVDKLYPAWGESCSKNRSEKDGQGKDKKKVKGGKKEDEMARIAKEFHTIPEGIKFIHNPLEVLTSYAYTEKRSPYFVTGIAFRELCHIKAKANGIAPCLRMFDETKMVAGSCLRALPRPEPMPEDED